MTGPLTPDELVEIRAALDRRDPTVGLGYTWATIERLLDTVGDSSMDVEARSQSQLAPASATHASIGAPSSVLPSVASEATPDATSWLLTRAKSALENWGRHFEWCTSWTILHEPCNCGLADAIRDATLIELPPESERLDPTLLRMSLRAAWGEMNQLRADLAAVRSLLRDAQRETPIAWMVVDRRTGKTLQFCRTQEELDDWGEQSNEDHVPVYVRAARASLSSEPTGNSNG
jgi:hypothetical protein